ncbi:hypothetical protein JI735_19560 [Paenibacillus sonchi]|uniref:Uncharacterized protein n=1 Tax=Paenibacillus sonchi TaxID=373687 RepID=A0A974SB48_9BACL|nr:hypothetical protein [Paenibacillus sonchi]QQZ58929.1 hypothetical protein JI735_19560 [Paenibacillus sonchi]
MSSSKVTRLFKRLFHAKHRQEEASIANQPTAAISKEQQWEQMKARWEDERKASSSEAVLNDLLRQTYEAEVMENVQSTLEEALSLLDDAASEAPEPLKSEITAIWRALDELVQKTFTESN